MPVFRLRNRCLGSPVTDLSIAADPAWRFRLSTIAKNGRSSGLR